MTKTEETAADMMQPVKYEVDAYGCSKVLPKLLKMLDKKDSAYESWRDQNAT